MNALTTIHIGLTRPQAEGVIVLAGHAIERAAGLLPEPARRSAAERGLVRLRGAVQGLRPGDVDLQLEALGADIAGIASADARELFAARVRDAANAARLWRALEEAYRVAIRDDAQHVDHLYRLLHPEQVSTALWQRDAHLLLRSIASVRDRG